MANKRNLKKDVAFLAQDLFSNVCFQNTIGAIDTTKAAEIFVEVAEFRKAFIAKVNHPGFSDPKDRKAVRAAYVAVRNQIFERFAEIAAKIAQK